MPGSTPLPHSRSSPLGEVVTDVPPPALRGAIGSLDALQPELADGWAPEILPAGHPSPSSLRREILFSLRQNGPASPDQIAARIGASRTGVLQQLRALEATNLVFRQTLRHGVGRPRHLYDITTDAQELFPTNYDGLAMGLIAAVRAMGGEELIEDLFAARRRQMGDRIRRQLAERLPAGAPLVDRVRQLAVIQDEQGYLCHASVSADGTMLLQEHNCAIFHVAKGNPAACQAELDLFRDVLGADVVRESHIATGDRCCSYRILGPMASRSSASDPRADGVAGAPPRILGPMASRGLRLESSESERPNPVEVAATEGR